MTVPSLQVLITGCYRSGTTYITQLLNNSPRLAATMHVVNFLRFCYGRYDPISVAANRERLVRDAAERIEKRWHLALDVEFVLREADDQGGSYATIYDAMMRDLFVRPGMTGWAEKSQLVWTRVPAFFDMFPDGKVILVIRDPRSILASFKHFTYAPEPAYLGAVFNSLGALQHAQTHEEQFGPQRVRTVRYEDVVVDPPGETRAMLDFLGLPADHELTSTEGWSDAKGDPLLVNSSFQRRRDRLEGFDARAAVRRWEEHLAPWEVALCEAVHGDFFEAFGYERSGLEVPWTEQIGPISRDPVLWSHLRHWLRTGSGIEAFPTDPEDPENWTATSDQE